MTPTLRHRLVNIGQSILLIGFMAGLAWICASAIWGADVALWVLAATGGLLLLSPSMPQDLILSLYRAKRLSEREFPEGIALLRALAERAGLRAMPALYYIPSTVPNAFAVGQGPGSAIAISDGMLRTLNGRELAGVLAHEVTHIANRDLWIMGLADIMARFTTVSSFVGQFLLILNLPLILMGEVHLPWTVPLLLAFSPTIMSLLQLALSRAREFDADLGAARLTGDPAGLASALDKLERSTGRFWEEILLPGRRIPEPSLLRTHPSTPDRIRRLMALDPDAFRPRRPPPASMTGPSRPRIVARPRWHRTGVWY